MIEMWWSCQTKIVKKEDKMLPLLDLFKGENVTFVCFNGVNVDIEGLILTPKEMGYVNTWMGLAVEDNIIIS